MLILLPPLLSVFLCSVSIHPGHDRPRSPSLRRWDTMDPGCFSSGRASQVPGKGLSPSDPPGLRDLHLEPLCTSPWDEDAMLLSSMTQSSGMSTLHHIKVRCTFIVFLRLVFSMLLHSYPQSWRATKASELLCCTLGWPISDCRRQRFWIRTSGAWSRRYAAHCPRQGSSFLDLYQHTNDEMKVSVYYLL